MVQSPRQFINERLGGPDAVAEAVGRKSRTVQMWAYRRSIPRAVWPDILDAYPKVKLAELKALETARGDA